jgi:hypothetical protein
MTAETYDNLPDEVKAIVDTWTDEGDKYVECRRVINELEKIGWTGDYGLDGEIYGVWKIGEYMCVNCGGGFSEDEMIMGDEDLDADFCTSCYPK